MTADVRVSDISTSTLEGRPILDKRSETPHKYASCLSAMESQAIYHALDIIKKVMTVNRVRFKNPTAVRDYLRLDLAFEEREVFVCLWLDAQHRLIDAERMFFGTLTQTSVYPREVVKSALRHNAAAVVFAHNHPSGVPEPSEADISLTTSLKNSLALVDVRVIDHFIVGGSEMPLSFAEAGIHPLGNRPCVRNDVKAVLPKKLRADKDGSTAKAVGARKRRAEKRGGDVD